MQYDDVNELSDFDQIWCADADIYITRISLTKSRKFANSRWRPDAILKIFLLYLCTILAD